VLRDRAEARNLKCDRSDENAQRVMEHSTSRVEAPRTSPKMALTLLLPHQARPIVDPVQVASKAARS
jgi:hypothetical protein